MIRKVVFMGPQGSGKGTVIGRIKARYGVPHISTGEMFREAIKEGTEFGKKAKEYIDKGELVPDEVTIGMVQERINKPDCERGFMLDGFPRNLPQAKALAEITEITHSVLLDVPEEISLERLSGRRQCRDCGAIFHLVNIPPKKEGICDKCGGELYQRDDDNVETVTSRLEVYTAQTLPLIDYYKAQGKVRPIDGVGEIKGIFERITQVLS